jgi:4-hydroxy-tetrahydrodipicolinate synthase
VDPKAVARATVRGLWIAIPTPFTADGAEVDEEALAASVEHYIAVLQVDGIFCGGVMGEFWALSLPERKRVHELVATVAAGRVPVMAQVGHHAVVEAAELSNHAAAHGVDFGIAMNPYYPPRLPFAQVRAWYEALAERASLPLFLFNTPYSGTALTVEQIVELAEIEIVCGIKNPQSRDHLLQVQERVGDRIVVADAIEREWLDLHVEHGFQALMSTPALALYQTPGNLPIVDYTRLADAGDVDGARAISDRLGPQRDAFQKWLRRPWLDDGVIPIAQLKAWLGLLGLPQGPVRAPLVPLTREQERELRSDLEAIGLLEGSDGYGSR